jgi:hypothetical protein
VTQFIEHLNESITKEPHCERIRFSYVLAHAYIHIHISGTESANNREESYIGKRMCMEILSYTKREDDVKLSFSKGISYTNHFFLGQNQILLWWELK